MLPVFFGESIEVHPEPTHEIRLAFFVNETFV